MSIKKISCMLLMLWIGLLADARSAGITAAQWKDLTARVRALETAIEVDAEKNADEDDAGLRLVVDKIEHFISELTSLRKELFGKIKQIRKDIKSHAGDIVVLKHSYKALEKALGNPASMQTVAYDAKTVFEVIAMIHHDLILVKNLLGIGTHASSSADLSSESLSAAETLSSSAVSASVSGNAADSSVAVSTAAPVVSAS